MKQLEILEKDLKNNYDTANAMFENGTTTLSDIDLIHVELLNNEQRKTELNTLRSSYLEMLSTLINEKIPGQTLLEKPAEIPVNPAAGIVRPEITLFNKQRALYDAQESLIASKNRPRLSLFAREDMASPD